MITRWLAHPLFGPGLALAALGWGTLVVAFLVVGPNVGGVAVTVLAYCFGWNGVTHAYRLDTILIATLETPLFIGVVAIFYGDDLRAVLGRRRGRAVGGGAAALFVTAVVALALTGRVGAAGSATITPMRAAAPAPGATLTDHRGQAFALGAAGRPLALTFIYTDCHASCPVLVARLRTAQAEVGGRARFAAVTLAPEVDSVDTLAQYARRWDLGADFHLLTGTPATVHAVVAAYGVRTERGAGGEIGHDNVIVLIDGRGRLAYRLGLSQWADVAPLLARLASE